MREKRVVSAQAVNTLLFPAVNVLRGIELDLLDHPHCPYRDKAKKAINNLMQLMDMANGKVPEGKTGG